MVCIRSLVLCTRIQRLCRALFGGLSLPMGSRCRAGSHATASLDELSLNTPFVDISHEYAHFKMQHATHEFMSEEGSVLRTRFIANQIARATAPLFLVL